MDDPRKNVILKIRPIKHAVLHFEVPLHVCTRTLFFGANKYVMTNVPVF